MADFEAIITENLTRDFNGLHAVNQLNLLVPTGKVFGFLGPNGAGKTTTIHLLLGLLAPTAGTAKVLGYDIRSAAGKIREQTGVLLEHTGLYERLTAEDNLDFYGRIWGMAVPERQARSKELLHQLGLEERQKEVVAKWSKGMKQKLAVARAIFHRPPLIFLDEPTSGLDPVSASQLHQDLMELVRHEGTTIFLTTHNLAEAEQLCNLVAVIRQGQIIAYGSPAELRSQGTRPQAEIEGANFTPALIEALKARPEVAEVTLKDNLLSLVLTGSSKLAPVVKLVVEKGGQIEEVRKGYKSLEEVFLTLVAENSKGE